MTDGKMLGILENLKEQYKREAKDKEDREILSALEMACEFLAKGIDLAIENGELKAKLEELYQKNQELLDDRNTWKDSAIEEARLRADLRVKEKTLKECISLIVREVCDE